MCNRDLFNDKEALDMLVSYSISEEGSNNLYLGLIKTMLLNREQNSYDMVEIEMILNYLRKSNPLVAIIHLTWFFQFIYAFYIILG